jgi:xylulokinase
VLPGLLYRAALEGVSLALKAGYDQMISLGMKMHQEGEDVSNGSGHADAHADICLVGGGAQNPLWRQILADVFQKPIRWVTDSGWCFPEAH